MFPISSQKLFWMFEDEAALRVHRQQANRDFIERNKSKLSTGIAESDYFLNDNEEYIIVKFYEFELVKLGKNFEPKLPCDVQGTAIHFFKRFYVHNSVMDFHPKEMLATCIFLACKVEEFNIPLNQFVSNFKGNKEKASQAILSYELLLMQKLNYCLMVHNVYKPIEGFLLDLKVRSHLKDADKLRSHMDALIDKLYLTDACLLYTPSQLALAIVLHNASRNSERLDSYVTKTLLGGKDANKLPNLADIIRKIRTLLIMPDVSLPNWNEVKLLDKKLARCRCEENNPNSEVFKQKIRELNDVEFYA